MCENCVKLHNLYEIILCVLNLCVRLHTVRKCTHYAQNVLKKTAAPFMLIEVKFTLTLLMALATYISYACQSQSTNSDGF